jgi:large subunit ribosomal protein L4
MEINILDINGKDTGRKAKLNDSIFLFEPNDHAIYLDVKQYMANQRQGNHKSKERAEIKGSTRKIKKQKGTGTARVGSIKSPLLRGGGTIFGPRPRSYSFKLNKKVKLIARKSAFAIKFKEKSLIIVENINLDKPSTSSYLSFLQNLKVTSKKSLLVLEDSNKNVYLSSRNLSKSKVVTTNELNTYEILDAGVVLISEGAIKNIESNLS